MAASVAFEQMRDLIEIQETLLDSLRRQVAVQEENSVSKVEYEAVIKKLKMEEDEHRKTKNKLAMESEQLEFALGEIDVLSKQLEREKQAFDSTLSRVNCKVQKQSFQKDKLMSKCIEIETHIQKQEDILNCKEKEIKKLQQCVDKQKQTLKKQASDFTIQKQQENYITQVLGGKKGVLEFLMVLSKAFETVFWTSEGSCGMLRRQLSRLPNFSHCLQDFELGFATPRLKIVSVL
uniref:Spermatogenesis-associated protein 24 n=1 Tax=Salvator merianae TaxID=96440 RepID=A0A8D0BF70_SALMN